ncbi:FAD-dependent oxidoreductase [Nocardioides sp. BP30]|uniref:phytoene desaturase family protein n=1 Tax=Nocardioides sp. BP30 TaxID=3036374 RepID=UPI002468C128|nr:FAD-dependent oxidoreductase [Nocardioides sp. BP30]WGL53845.1 FAD-dependent oxidoreductase [Nocardioides sp. BP30]
MARVVVIGGGFGGMAAAARLAKLGHEVTLVEASDHLGGALEPIRQDGFTWDGGPTMTLLPAVIRDLFRKSGRPLERELDLEPVQVIREHRFEDRSRVQMTGGSRAAQLEAFDTLGTGLGKQWVDFVASYAEDWEVLRQHYFEVPWTPAALPREVAARLDSRETLAKRIRRRFKDRRMRQVAGFPFEAEGHSLRDVPAWAGLVHYLEQRFGAWSVPGGMFQMAGVLEQRLATRGVDVHTSTVATDVVLREGRVAAVTLSGPTGEVELATEMVVAAIDPRRLPVTERYAERTLPAMPPQIVHLGLADGPELPAAEVVLHGDPLLVVRGSGNAWTVHVRGRLLEDVTVALARHRLDVRDRVLSRVDLGPRELVGRWGGSPYGPAWMGRGTVRRRLGPTTPIPGLYAAGAHATPGAGLPFVGLSAALVAQAVTTDTGGGDLRA